MEEPLIFCEFYSFELYNFIKNKNNNPEISKIIPVKINSAKGVTLFGESLTKEELLYETN